MDRVLVTGCSGYIGRNIIPHLKETGCIVFGIDRQPYDSVDLDDFWQKDLLDVEFLERILTEVNGVIHLAAAKDDWGITCKEYFRDNFYSTQKLLYIGRKKSIKNWVFYSSVSTMGSSRAPLDENTKLAPTTAYGKSKAEAERLFREFYRDDPEARILIIRPSVVFGPGNPSNTNIYRLIDAIYTNNFFMIGKGESIKTTSYIENLVAATLFLIDHMKKGLSTFNYVDYPKISTAYLVHYIYTILQKKQPAWWIPLHMAVPLAYVSDVVSAITKKDFPITAARIKKFCTSTNYDASAIHALGFKQPVSIEEALRRTVQWHLELKDD